MYCMYNTWFSIARLQLSLSPSYAFALDARYRSTVSPDGGTKVTKQLSI